MGFIQDEKVYGLTLRESADDGSDFTNPAADYRRFFLGEDGALHLKDSSGTVTDVGGSSSGFTVGTSNPGGPSTNDLVFRTDLGMMFQYNGTRWLCTCPHTQSIANQHALLVVSATNSLRAPAPAAEGCSDIWLTTFNVAIYVTTTNTGAAYWTVSYGAATVNTSANSPDTVYRKTANINTVWNFATDKWFQVDFTKTGSAGTAYPMAGIGYRYIAP